ncbi:3-phenylpropionic acid transporter [Vibrio sp. 10N.286.49.C2]|uniref:3-phenylpropionate MFS transporter n=1 Tax=unclassified Vibrio TaxID=2614977 RepID=UPI000C85BCFB|nr:MULTISPECIES: 3-phenylpropionate MFS transporter [unclassified Vibrio]PMH36829.1 3-phenylpropionic acid transporter [Vibrio sp. 10N.286.49.C2]PMH56739.1 3-phenylpropionic acid transporter [Vibrio sp. 10N.286.49.B1]PMH81726.1 3-phenylpropionic acid transporter [Vibrio sp. 10N.286.48.B7]
MLNPSPFAWVSQYLFGFFFSYGVYLPFWALWFEDQGVSATDVGMLMGLGFATRCVANLLITPRIHQVERLLPALRWATLACTIFIALHLAAGPSFVLLALVTVLFNLSFGPVVPLSDAMANHYASRGILDYGRTRLWGSIAFIVGSSVVGYLASQFGANMIVYTALAGFVLSMLLVMRTPVTPPASEGSHSMERPSLKALLCDRNVIRFLVLIALIQGSHAAYYSFSSIYWKEAGHPESVIGYLWSLGVVSEVMLFAFSKKWFAGWSLRTLFVISSIGVIIRWSLTASTIALPALVIIQLLHGVTFGIAHIAAIQYIQKSEPNKMVALQSLYNAIPLGAFIALMMAVSGWGYERWGAGIFWGMAFMGVLALFIKVEPSGKPAEYIKDISQPEPQK